MSPLYNMFNQSFNPPNPFNNIQQIINSFQQFRQQFTGDPKQQVQQLLNSGRMTPQQLQQLQNMASQFKSLFK